MKRKFRAVRRHYSLGFMLTATIVVVFGVYYYFFPFWKLYRSTHLGKLLKIEPIIYDPFIINEQKRIEAAKLKVDRIPAIIHHLTPKGL